MMDPVAELSKKLGEGEVTSLALTSACLDRILDTAGEGARAFTMIDPERSFSQAQQQDDWWLPQNTNKMPPEHQAAPFARWSTSNWH